MSDSNSFKDIRAWSSQGVDISFDDMVSGIRKYNNTRYDTCHSSLDTQEIRRSASSLIKRISKVGYLGLSPSYSQTFR